MRLLPARPRSLSGRLVVTAVALVVLVSVLVGAVATLATRAYLTARLGDDVQASLARVGSGLPEGLEAGGDGPDQPPSGPPPGDLDADGDGRGGPDDFRGAAVGTLSVLVPAEGPARGRVLVQERGGGLRERTLDAEALDELADLPADGTPREVRLDDLGGYLVASTLLPDGSTRVGTGLPLRGVDAVVGRLVAWELALTAGGALAAAGVGTLLVRRQLRPLREVAGTAREVAALPLSSGEIDLAPRVPARTIATSTEVALVGSALNALLSHVESSLDARHRSEQQVRQFVADASHELRTPLATIAGYAELARRRPDDAAAARTALDKVEGESRRMTALVEDLLLLARLDSGRPLERGAVDLSRLAMEAVADARVLAPDHRWRLDLPADPVEVLGDELRLHQVLTNLLTNARRHTPAGTVVTVAVRPGLLRVHDDGPGFAPEVAGHAFERFVRADPARARAAGAGGGVGPGLALVEAIVVAHGGGVDLTTAPGDTRVEVRLPTAPADA